MDPKRTKHRAAQATAAESSAVSWRDRYASNGDLDCLRRAIGWFEAAIAKTAPSDSSYVDRLESLALCKYELHREQRGGGGLAALRDARDAFSEALSHSRSNDPELSERFAQRAVTSVAIYEATGDHGPLLAAIRDSMCACAHSPAERLGRSENGLAANLTELFGATGEERYLRAALRVARRALERPAGTRERTAHENTLASALIDAYDTWREANYIDEAISLLESASAVDPEDSPFVDAALANLGVALRYRYRHTGANADLEAARRADEAVLARTPEGSARAGRLHNLAVTLKDWFRATGLLRALDDAIEHSEQAVAAAPLGTAERAQYLDVLGNLLATRWERRRDPADLDRSISLASEVLEVSTSPIARAAYLNNIALRLAERHRRDETPIDIDRAIELQRESLALTPSNSIDRPGRLANLAGHLRLRGGDTDIEHGLAAAREAVVLSDPHSLHLAARLGTVARLLAASHERTHDEALRAEAAQMYRRACRHGLTRVPAAVLTMAQHWGEWMSSLGDWTDACDAYAYALIAQRRVVERQVARADKESWLAEGRGLAAAAGYAFARAGRLEAAVMAVEEARSLLLAEALQLEVSTLADLTATGHADLVDAFERAARRIDALGSSEGPVDGAALRDAQAELRSAGRAIQAVPGFEGFMARMRFADLVNLSGTRAALVYLLAAPNGGLALIVGGRRSQVEAVWLPDLTDSVARDTAQAWLDIEDERVRSVRLDPICASLWALGMGDVLEGLSGCDEAVLLPTGTLTVLPLHAAWRPDDCAPSKRLYACDRIVLRYAPSATALRTSLRRAEERCQGSLLGVADPSPTGEEPLPNAIREVEYAASRFMRSRNIAGSAATREHVLEALADHGTLHMACHGVANLVEPLRSGLVLADDELLSVRDLIERVHLPQMRLAFLSACRSGMPGAALPDEVVGLPTGFIAAGAAGVISSMWPIDDTGAALLAARFYETWIGETHSPAVALNRAQRWLRDATIADALQSLPGAGDAVTRSAAAGELRELLLAMSGRTGSDHRPWVGIDQWAAFVCTGA